MTYDGFCHDFLLDMIDHAHTLADAGMMARIQKAIRQAITGVINIQASQRPDSDLKVESSDAYLGKPQADGIEI